MALLGVGLLATLCLLALASGLVHASSPSASGDELHGLGLTRGHFDQFLKTRKTGNRLHKIVSGRGNGGDSLSDSSADSAPAAGLGDVSNNELTDLRKSLNVLSMTQWDLMRLLRFRTLDPIDFDEAMGSDGLTATLVGATARMALSVALNPVEDLAEMNSIAQFIYELYAEGSEGYEEYLIQTQKLLTEHKQKLPTTMFEDTSMQALWNAYKEVFTMIKDKSGDEAMELIDKESQDIMDTFGGSLATGAVATSKVLNHPLTTVGRVAAHGGLLVAHFFSMGFTLPIHIAIGAGELAATTGTKEGAKAILFRRIKLVVLELAKLNLAITGKSTSKEAISKAPLWQTCEITSDEQNHGCPADFWCQREFPFGKSSFEEDKFLDQTLSAKGFCVPRANKKPQQVGAPCVDHSDCESSFCMFGVYEDKKADPDPKHQPKPVKTVTEEMLAARKTVYRSAQYGLATPTRSWTGESAGAWKKIFWYGWHLKPRGPEIGSVEKWLWKEPRRMAAHEMGTLANVMIGTCAKVVPKSDSCKPYGTAEANECELFAPVEGRNFNFAQLKPPRDILDRDELPKPTKFPKLPPLRRQRSFDLRDIQLMGDDSEIRDYRRAILYPDRLLSTRTLEDRERESELSALVERQHFRRHYTDHDPIFPTMRPK